MSNNIKAVRAFNRVMRPIVDGMARMAVCDHEFDAGEWSDAASAREAERVEEEVAFRVGQRFGLSTEHLLQAVWVAQHVQDDNFMAAVLS